MYHSTSVLTYLTSAGMGFVEMNIVLIGLQGLPHKDVHVIIAFVVPLCTVALAVCVVPSWSIINWTLKKEKKLLFDIFAFCCFLVLKKEKNIEGSNKTFLFQIKCP